MLTAMTDADPVPILLDCDPGHDDVVAIMVAARFGRLLGITTVAGNAPLDKTTYNACVVRDMVRLGVPVHSGAVRPVLAEPHPADFVHGASGLDGADLPPPDRGPDGTDAVGFIVETCRANPGLRVVATGPLTNVALALRAAPDLADHLGGISVMGGGSFGNRTGAAEFNIWADPEAAAIVFSSGAPMTMAGLDVTHQFLVTPDRIADVDAIGGRLAAVLGDLFRFFAATYIRRHDHIAGAALHDPLAVMAVTHPQLFTSAQLHVTIETRGEHTRGMTVIDRRGLKERPAPNCTVLETVDDAAAWELVLESIHAATESAAGNGRS
jgi:inosine-uridine nucleoside N-ribohydrolase